MVMNTILVFQMTLSLLLLPQRPLHVQYHATGMTFWMDDIPQIFQLKQIEASILFISMNLISDQFFVANHTRIESSLPFHRFLQ
nr:MAG TPA: hypothetical protein [Caudoviricetes sp.]